MTYNVLKPIYTASGQVTETAGGPIRWQRIAWAQVGTAHDMEHAKQQGFIAPVLEWAGSRPLKLRDFEANTA